MPDDITPQSVLGDPNFHALPLEERRKVMLTIDPDRYGKLAPAEQTNVLNMAGAKFAQPQVPGMDKLGGQLPPMPAAPLPPGLQANQLKDVAADPLNFSDRYNTPIPPDKQAAFNEWSKKQGRDVLKDRYDYDIQGAFLGGAGQAGNGHFTDTYKKPNHPTFSNESQYSGKDGFTGGAWSEQGGKTSYQPSATNLKFRSPDQLKNYFRQTEPDVTLAFSGPPVDPKNPAAGNLPSDIEATQLTDQGTRRTVQQIQQIEQARSQILQRATGPNRATPPIPTEMQTDQQKDAAALANPNAAAFVNPRTGARHVRTSTPVPGIDTPISGAQDIAEGLTGLAANTTMPKGNAIQEEMGKPQSQRDQETREAAGNLHQIAGGAFKAATPFLIGSGIAAPIKTAVALGAGYLSQQTVEHGLRSVGVPEEYVGLAGDAAAMLGGYAAHTGGSKLDSALEAHNTEAQRLLDDERLTGQRKDQGTALGDRLFPKPIPVDVPSEQGVQRYSIEFAGTGENTSTAQGGAHPRLFFTVKNAEGKPVYAGTGGSVQDFLRTRGAKPVEESGTDGAGKASPVPSDKPPVSEPAHVSEPSKTTGQQERVAETSAAPQLKNDQPTAKQVLADPDFHELPKPERQKVLQQIDPEYAKLSPETQERVLDLVPKPRAEDTPQPGTIARVPVGSLTVDAAKFQFKRNTGQGGAGDELRDVTKFDPEKSGVLGVWHDPADDKTYVVNGHHRAELASRTGGEDQPVDVRYLVAKDATEARTKGALINIAEGRGDSVDAAKVFRDSGLDAEGLQKEGVSLKGKVAKEGYALSNLDPHLFSKVASGEIPAERGAAIAEAAPEDQRALYDLTEAREKNGKRLTNNQISEMVRLSSAAPKTTETQDSLFGSEEVTRSLIPEKAEISDYVQKRLGQEKKLFTAVSTDDAAGKLAGTGNVIQAGKNAQTAQETGQAQVLYDKLSTSTGSVNDALDLAAAALAKGENGNDVKERAYGAIKQQLIRQAQSLTGRTQVDGGRVEELGAGRPLQNGSGELDRGNAGTTRASSAEVTPARASPIESPQTGGPTPTPVSAREQARQAVIEAESSSNNGKPAITSVEAPGHALATEALKQPDTRNALQNERDRLIAENAELRAKKEGKAAPSIPSGTAIAQSLRYTADRMQAQIDAKRNPAIAQQNPTARRANIASGMANQADGIERVQGTLRNLADAHEQGSVPEVLRGVKSRAAVEDLAGQRGKFPDPFIHPSYVRDLESALRGKPGTKKGLDLLARRFSGPDGGARLRGMDEISTIEDLTAKAKGIASAKWIENAIAPARRLHKAGITPENWAEAQAAMKQFTGAPKPHDAPARKIADLERGLIGRKIPGYFPTPQPLAADIVKRAEIEPGMSVLEPSAGNGRLADEAVKRSKHVTTIEPHSDLSGILALKGHTTSPDRDFLKHSGTYDRIVMNPPFEDGQDAQHVQHAYSLLKPGGRLVSVMGEGSFFGTDKKRVAFREWLDRVGGESQKLPAGSFEKSGTGVSTRLVTIDKPAAEQRGPRFLRPLRNTPYLRDAPIAGKIQESQLLHRPEKSLPGVVYANRQALDVLTQIGLKGIKSNADPSQADSISLTASGAERVAHQLRRAAVTLQHGLAGARPLLALARTLKEAARTGSVTIADAGPGRSLSDVKRAVRHEMHHGHETDLSPEAARELLSDPLAHMAAQTLVDERGYENDPIELASEIGAHLHSGDVAGLGLTVEQGRHLWKTYLSTQPGSYPTAHIHPIMRGGEPDAGRQRKDGQGVRSQNDTRGARESSRRRGIVAAGGSRDNQAPRTQEGLFDSDANDQVAQDSARDRDQLTGQRLTAQFNAPVTREEQLRKLKRGEQPAQTGMFEETPANPQGGLFGNERGGASTDLGTLGLHKLATDDVIPAVKDAAKAVVEAKNDIIKYLAPASRGPAAKTEALIVRKEAADLARRGDQAQAALKKARSYFESQLPTDNFEFIDRVETGRTQKSIHEEAIAKTMRELLDGRRQDVQNLGAGELDNFYDNYFPHVWKDTEAKRQFFENQGKGPLEGSKAFLKERQIRTIRQGLLAGLAPASNNPVDLVLQKIREMDKFVMAHRAMGESDDNGLLAFTPSNKPLPAGHAEINDAIAKVWTRKGEPTRYAAKPDPQKDLIDTEALRATDLPPAGTPSLVGRYSMPEPAARVLNNYLSAGLREKSGLFRAYLGAANVLNQFQLGWSAFHLGFTSMDAAVSKFALGIMQLAHGEPVAAAKSMLLSPVAPFTNIVQGDKLLKEWYKPGTQGAEVAAMVDAMVQAGGRARMDGFYQTQITQRMMDAFRRGNFWGGVWRAPFAATEQAVRPVLEYVVPRQKMGVFADLAREELRNLGPNADPMQVRAVLARAWDSVDNRMGQLVYDNLFWHKVAKDLAMASVRSVGWNLGTVRELLGGAGDFAKAGKELAGGKGPDFTPRMSYVLALPIVAAIAGAVYQYLRTGKGPEQLKDYFLPKNGNLDEAGNPERDVLPTYMKDVMHYGREPGTTVVNKLHPLLTTVREMLANKEYSGAEIRNVDDPIVQQALDLAKHALASFEPMAARNLLRERENQGDAVSQALPLIGITRAPASLTHSPAEQLMAEYAQAHREQGSRTKAQAEHAKAVHQITRDFRLGKDALPDIQKANAAGLLHKGDLARARGEAKRTPLQVSFNRLSLPEATRVYEKADAGERKQLRTMLFRKLPKASELPPEQGRELTRRVRTLLATGT